MLSETEVTSESWHTLQIRLPGEFVRPHEVQFKLHEAEVPLKNKVCVIPESFCPAPAFQHAAPCLTDTMQPSGYMLALAMSY